MAKRGWNGGKWGEVDFSQIMEFGEKLERLAEGRRKAFFEAAARLLAARLLAEVKQRTPVSDSEGAGTLRRGWTGGKDVSATTFAESLGVEQSGDNYVITIANDVYYAVYVEFGHRTANHKDWVEGQYMLTLSMQEVDQRSPRELEALLRQWLGEVFD